MLLSPTCSFFDSHCHFDFVDFDPDRAAIWRHCQSLGINRLLIPGVVPAQWLLAANLCRQFSGIDYSVGLHPYWITPFIEETAHDPVLENHLSEKQRLEKLRALLETEFESSHDGTANQSRIPLAVGECGLDKTIDTAFGLQQAVLDIHLLVAKKEKKPLILHCVKAHAELIAQLKANAVTCGGVVHAFSGSVEIAHDYINLGFMLGVGGVITFERAHKTRETLGKVPLEFLVLETDAPDMPLQGLQGQRNSPEYIPLIAQTLADLRGESVEKIAEVTYANSRRLFSK